MSQPILIRQGGLSGRWYVVTRWHTEGSTVVAERKYDVDDELRAQLIAAGWQPPAAEGPHA